MHMADALLSPAVGGTMWAVTGAAMVGSARKLSPGMNDRQIPLMGVLGAFVFAAQMINFTIPATGSSGHLGGGMLLAILLGPSASFLVMASILTIQSLFFADGGLLALGCNIFNLGFIPAFIVYPLICRPLLGRSPAARRITTAAVISAVLALQAGALGVVLETCLSGVSELSFTSFLSVMLPIHLAIGLVEGVVTAAVANFIWRAEPGILAATAPRSTAAGNLKPVLAGLLTVTVLTAIVVSWFASQHPDGLEWSIARITGSTEIEPAASGLHQTLAAVQEKTAILPDYGFRRTAGATDKDGEADADESWPAIRPGTSLSGVLGGAITLVLVILIGWILSKRQPRIPQT